MEKFATKVFPRLVNNGESRPRSVLTTLFSPEIARLLKLNEFQYVPRAARRTFRAVHYIVCTFGDAGARRYLQRRRPDSKTLNGSFGEEFSPFRPPLPIYRATRARGSTRRPRPRGLARAPPPPPPPPPGRFHHLVSSSDRVLKGP